MQDRKFTNSWRSSATATRCNLSQAMSSSTTPISPPLPPPPHHVDGTPTDKAQRNFTDPQSRILKTADGYEWHAAGRDLIPADDHDRHRRGACSDLDGLEVLEVLVDDLNLWPPERTEALLHVPVSGVRTKPFS